MDTLKTVFVVGLLGVVLYFAYTFLSKEEGSPPPEVADLTEDLDDLSAPKIDLGPSLSPDSEDYQSRMQAELLDSSADSSNDPPEVGIPSYEQADEQADGGGGVTSTPDPYGTADPYAGNDPYGEVDPYAANDPYLGDSSGGSTDGGYAPSRPPYGDNVGVDESNAVGQGNEQADRALASGGPKRGIPNPYSGAEDTTSAGRSTAGRSTAEQITIADWVGEKQTVQKLIAESRHAEALRHLSTVYRSQQLSDADRIEALDIMDPLAGMVIYSRDHVLAAPYVVKRDETLVQIAQNHNVPMALLRNINGIDDPQTLRSGAELKVVRGPFSADIDTVTSEMTLYVQDMYAGRFAVRVGANPAPSPGTFRVNKKEDGKTFVAAQDGALPKDHPQNPYGRVWIDLGNSVGIHGSHQPLPNELGCISLSPLDANDVFAILSQGSTVIVR